MSKGSVQVVQKSFLSKKFFFFFCIWQLASSVFIAFDDYFLLLVAVLLAVSGIVLVFLDYLSCLIVDEAHVRIFTEHPIELGKQVDVNFMLRDVAGSGRMSLLELEVPPCSKLESTCPSVLPLKRVGEDGNEYTVSIPMVGTRLGTQHFSHIRIRVRSMLGLWLRQVTIDSVDSNLKVEPSLAEPPAWYLSRSIKGNDFSASVTRLLAVNNAPDQVRSIRDWRFPDPIRYLDHKKSARYDRPMTRTFDSYHQKHLIIALDLGRALCGSVGKSKKLDYYLSVVVWLAQFAIEQGDKVSVIGFSDTIDLAITRASHMSEFNTLLHDASSIQAKPIESDYHLLPVYLNKIAQGRSIVMLLSDVVRSSIQSSLRPAIPMLARSHLLLVSGLFEKQYSLDDLLQHEETFPRKLLCSVYMRTELPGSLIYFVMR